jgi:hypothetical protein
VGRAPDDAGVFWLRNGTRVNRPYARNMPTGMKLLMIISVRTALGLTALTRIPYRPYSTAAEWVWTVVIVTRHLSDHVFRLVEIAVWGFYPTRPLFRSSELTICSSPGSR